MTEVAVTSRVVRAEVYARGAQVTRLIERDWYRLGEWNLVDRGHCASCGHEIAGVFDDRPGDWGPRRLPVSMHEPVEQPSE